MRSSVVFPHPEGPSSATSSPSATVSDIPFSASKAPNDFTTRSMTMSATMPHFDPTPQTANRYFLTANMKATEGTMSNSAPAKR